MEPFEGRFRHLYDLDGLRASGAKPAWFGLGFIQLKLDADTRMHFWHPELTPDTSEEELHDHRYSFTSRILVGQIIHEEWVFTPHQNGDSEMVRVACQPGKDADPEPVARGWLQQGNSYTMAAGSEYTFGETGFHRIRATRAVTYLTRGPVTKEYANVVRPISVAMVCPFARQEPEERLWECIADLLQGRQARPGYHLQEIPRGELGEASKILEETLEFMDAVGQGCDVMALVELSDLQGAIAAWLERRHPTIRPEDLSRMAEITARAFRNGRR